MDDKRMPFLDHLEELRWSLVRCLAAVAAGFVLALLFVRRIVKLLEWPFREAGVGMADAPQFLRTISVAESFTTVITIAGVAGMALALPYVFFEIWKFVSPGLTRPERRAVAPLIFFGTAFFFSGVAFCHQVILPQALKYFLQLNQTFGWAAEWRMQDFLSFSLTMLFAAGVMAELPVLTVVLARFGIVSAPFLIHYWRHAVVTLFILAAVLTPSSDPLTMLLLAGPLMALYALSILLAKLFYVQSPLFHAPS
ncbi:twin-arginine translocase subunit TatC [bacterium]|nr:twin-arginine translocase subunit TatC [bacterium]